MPDPRHSTRRFSPRIVGALLTLIAGGCSLGGGRLRVVGLGSDEAGFKMLQPAARARACGVTVWPYGARSGGGLLETALADLRDGNAEADVLRDVHVSWRGIDLLVAEVGCVSVRGDVGRAIPTVALPMLGDHGHHGQHEDGATDAE